jgi:hypothetical protein
MLHSNKAPAACGCRLWLVQRQLYQNEVEPTAVRMNLRRTFRVHQEVWSEGSANPRLQRSAKDNAPSRLRVTNPLLATQRATYTRLSLGTGRLQPS